MQQQRRLIQAPADSSTAPSILRSAAVLLPLHYRAFRLANRTRCATFWSLATRFLNVPVRLTRSMPAMATAFSPHFRCALRSRLALCVIAWRSIGGTIPQGPAIHDNGETFGAPKESKQ
jgi:hypothetical protein